MHSPHGAQLEGLQGVPGGRHPGGEAFRKTRGELEKERKAHAKTKERLEKTEARLEKLRTVGTAGVGSRLSRILSRDRAR